MELRKDYVLDKWVIISEARSKRPREFSEPARTKEEGVCYFCPGNEHLTPPEISRAGDPWRIRVFPNKFPAVSQEKKPQMQKKGFLASMPAYGAHEVIVETSNHGKQLADLGEEELAEVLSVYRERIAALESLPETLYAHLFKNHGSKAGTSLVHSHSQLVSLPLVPPAIKEKLNALSAFQECPYCTIVKDESESERFCFQNQHFSAFTPYASMFNYEIAIMPKKHVSRFSLLTREELVSLASLMRRILVKLKELNSSYNFYIHHSPKNGDMHLQIYFTPRIATWAGMELGSGIVINSVSPEDAASFYRGE